MAIPNLVVVFLCVLAAGAIVIVGAAFGKQFLPGNRNGEEESAQRDWTQMSPEQLNYCRSAVTKNLNEMVTQLRYDSAQPHPVWDTSSGYGPSSVSAAYVNGRYSNDHQPAQMYSEHGR